MPDKRLLIFTAVALEAKAVARALGMECPRPAEPVYSMNGTLAIGLAIIGIRACALDAAAYSIEPTHVLMAGVAGALDPKLKIGDVVVEGVDPLGSEPAGTTVGRICCSDRIVETPDEKADLFRSTGALAVEMENDGVRAWAEGRGAAFIAIRAISDRADQSLDPAVLRLVDHWGRARPLAIAATLARRPNLIPQLTRLGRDSKLASDRLGRAVKELVECWTSG